MGTSAPSFLDRLQSAEHEQGLVQLRTLMVQHQLSLARLPRLAQELEQVLEAPAPVDYAALAAALQTTLNEANDFLLALDLAPIDHPNQPELVTLGQSLCALVSSANVRALAAKFQEAKAAAVVANIALEPLLRRRAAAKARGYIDHGDGTVTDTHTGLMWKQYAEGIDPERIRMPGEYSWETAMKIPQTLNQRGGFAGHQDWRLPSKEELESLVFHHGQAGTLICPEAFPGVFGGLFWTSSVPMDCPNSSWLVDFMFNEECTGGHEYAYHVRLVR